MSAPKPPPIPESAWYYVSELQNMLSALRAEGKSVPSSKDLKKNEARVAAIRKVLGKFPVLEEARALFPDLEFRGRRGAPETRADWKNSSDMDGDSDDSGEEEGEGIPKFSLTGESKVESGQILVQVVNEKGTDLWTKLDALESLGFKMDSPEVQGILKATARPVPIQVQPSSTPTPTALVRINYNVATLRMQDGKEMYLPVSEAIAKYPNLLAEFLRSPTQSSASVPLPPQGYQQDQKASQDLLDVKKYEDMTFPYDVSGLHSTFTAPNVCNPLIMWKLWTGKMRKLYHKQRELPLAAFARVRVNQGSLSIKQNKIQANQLVEMTPKDIAWAAIEGYEITKRLKPQVFFLLLARRNMMDLHCYYGWAADRCQDIRAFESALFDLNTKVGYYRVAMIYDAVMERRYDQGVGTKYSALMKYVREIHGNKFYQPDWVDDAKPDWILQVDAEGRKNHDDFLRRGLHGDITGSKLVIEPTGKRRRTDAEHCIHWMSGYCRFGKKCYNIHDGTLKNVLGRLKKHKADKNNKPDQNNQKAGKQQAGRPMPGRQQRS